MRSAMVAGGITGLVLAFTLVFGPLFSRLPFEQPPVDVLGVSYSEADGVPVVDVRVRNNESYDLTGEVWYVIAHRSDGLPVYEQPPLPFGPLEARSTVTLRLERPGWVPAEGFELTAWARETFATPLEPPPAAAPSAISLPEEGVEIVLGDVRLERLRTQQDSARLTLSLELANLAAEARNFRVIFTLWPASSPRAAFYESPFQDLALGPGQRQSVAFEDRVVVTPGTYMLSGWLQVQDEAGLYVHVVKIDSPQSLAVGE